MKNILLALLFISLNSFAQIQFEDAYIIDNNGNRIEGLIKNIDWNNNPEKFSFKSDSVATIIEYGANSISEFGVNGIIYKRFTVDIDRSGLNISSMSYERNPEFIKETLFLKLQVDGSAKLYSYLDNNLSRFFYSFDDQMATQLVYKKYKRTETEIGTNVLYKQQLATILICESIDPGRVDNISYTIKPLANIFKDYNSCINPDLVYQQQAKKGVLRFGVRPGVTLNNFKITNDTDTYFKGDIVNFKNVIGFRLGVEIEYLLPFNKNKWSVFTEPNFNYFTQESLDYLNQETQIKYSSFELPIGIRHYFYLNNDSKLFLNGALLLVFPIDSSVELYDTYDYEFEKDTNYSLGAGYQFKNRYSFEFQYKGVIREAFDRGLIKRTSKFTTLSLILGYRFL